MPDDALNGKEAAEYLGVSKQRIYDLAAEGRIGQKIAGYWVFTKKELDRYKATKNPIGRPKDESAASV